MKKLSSLIDLITYAVCCIIILGSVLWLLRTLDGWKDDSTRYNCSVAEISPDFTTAMKDTCRKLRREQ
jgi:hypothetical protein